MNKHCASISNDGKKSKFIIIFNWFMSKAFINIGRWVLHGDFSEKFGKNSTDSVKSMAKTIYGHADWFFYLLFQLQQVLGKLLLLWLLINRSYMYASECIEQIPKYIYLILKFVNCKYLYTQKGFALAYRRIKSVNK